MHAAYSFLRNHLTWRTSILVLAVVWASMTFYLSIIPNRRIHEIHSLQEASSNLNYSITNTSRRQLYRGLEKVTASDESLRRWKRRLPVDGLLHGMVATILFLLLLGARIPVLFAGGIAILHSSLIEGVQHYLPYRNGTWIDLKFPCIIVISLGLLLLVWQYYTRAQSNIERS